MSLMKEKGCLELILDFDFSASRPPINCWSSVNKCAKFRE